MLNRLRLDSTIARNSVFLLVSEAMARVLNFVVFLFLYRYLGPEGSGVMRFVVNYGLLFGILSELGLTRVAVREMARLPADAQARTFGRVIVIRLVLCAFSFTATLGSLLTPLGQNLDVTTRCLIVLYSLSCVCQAMRSNSGAVLVAVQRMKFHAVFLVMNRSISAVAVLSIIWCKGSLVAVFVAYLVADALDMLLMSLTVRRRFLRPVYELSRNAVGALVKSALPFSLQLIAWQIYAYSNVVLLRYLLPAPPNVVEAETGYFSSAYQILMTLLFIPMSVCNALFPALSKAWHDDRRQFESLIGYGFSLFMLSGIPLGAIFFSLRGEVIPLLFGAKFANAIPMLGVIIWTLPLMFLTQLLNNVLGAADRQGYVCATFVANAVFCVALCWILIPAKGGMGVAISMTATEAFALLTFATLVVSFHRNALDYARAGKILLFHCAWIAPLLALDHAGAGWRIAVLAAYLGTSGVWGYSLVRGRRRLQASGEAAG